MEIGGNNSKSTDFNKFFKTPENVKISRPDESNNSLSEKENNEIEIKNAVSKINKVLEGEGTHLQYEKHAVLNQMIITVINNNTNQVIREIPSKKILDMVAKMCEMAGILVNKKA
ncbi:flagellar protein FlaG [Clostridium lacusfryxellense]|uniref:flagellar protein FlaG n=1 Tax=Clostridium lacusfryxellense TaxID=205328 RepID=UPI001C0BB648|nr:flagellar protein FlaG [Clostridium lacusfryxellense]MBU3111763.1 flagellar protein FlaG [Clostridium lacusfryxellense]